MVIFEDHIRVGAAVQIGPYTFKDQDDAVIDLSSFSAVVVELKLQGAVYSTETAAFISKPLGTVKLASYSFPTAGIWMAQFIVDSTLKGEPVRFHVVKNVDGADTSELLVK